MILIINNLFRFPRCIFCPDGKRVWVKFSLPSYRPNGIIGVCLEYLISIKDSLRPLSFIVHSALSKHEPILNQGWKTNFEKDDQSPSNYCQYFETIEWHGTITPDFGLDPIHIWIFDERPRVWNNTQKLWHWKLTIVWTDHDEDDPRNRMWYHETNLWRD